jgi:hypothetical protein
VLLHVYSTSSAMGPWRSASRRAPPRQPWHGPFTSPWSAHHGRDQQIGWQRRRDEI